MTCKNIPRQCKLSNLASQAFIPLCTVSKSSQSRIAISNHKWDPRLPEQGLGLGPGGPGGGTGQDQPTPWPHVTAFCTRGHRTFGAWGERAGVLGESIGRLLTPHHAPSL